MERPSEISLHFGSLSSKSAFGPPVQFNAFAKIRAMVVLPVPRGPQKDTRARCVLLDGVPERLRDVLLADDIRKRLRTIFSGDDLIRHGNSKLKIRN